MHLDSWPVKASLGLPQCGVPVISRLPQVRRARQGRQIPGTKIRHFKCPILRASSSRRLVQRIQRWAGGPTSALPQVSRQQPKMPCSYPRTKSRISTRRLLPEETLGVRLEDLASHKAPAKYLRGSHRLQSQRLVPSSNSTPRGHRTRQDRDAVMPVQSPRRSSPKVCLWMTYLTLMRLPAPTDSLQAEGLAQVRRTPLLGAHPCERRDRNELAGVETPLCQTPCRQRT